MSVDMRQREELLGRFRKVLVAAAEERGKRQFTVYGPDGLPEPGWAAYERQEIQEAVNAELRARGLPEVTEEEIWRVEITAMGHSDYAHKYALRCAFLVERAVSLLDEEKTP